MQVRSAVTLVFEHVGEADAEAASLAPLRRELEAAGGGDLQLEIAIRPAALGLPRASYLRCLLPAGAPEALLVALAGRAARRLPLLWGACGFVFDYSAHARRTAHTRMAALAKRFWCVQVQDMTALQWDGLRGMPSVNWLNIVGERFAAAKGLDAQQVLREAGPLREAGVFARMDHACLWLAAGAHALRGDLHAAEALGPYVRVAQLLEPVLLKEHTPLAGPFARAEVLSAWLGRFARPRDWLECELQAR
jgi:hypothetical protein